ncbi:MAG: hypothetical protein ONB11_06350 [candidate division KSB1 bacterium]|nr:hypothetical protein [candidate division KSB1 bacterium]
MDKERLKQLVENPNFISGIYNYCDRWCERCSFTKRCLNYAMGEEEGSPDFDSDAFWKQVESSFQLAMELLAELAEERGIDLSDVDAEEDAAEHQRTREAAESHEIARAAKAYGKMVDAWFKTKQPIFKERGDDLTTELEIGLGTRKILREANSIVDTMQVITWYQHQIYVKIMRALMGTDLAEWEDKVQNDSNGSAKVALIGIDRSIAAWARLVDHFPDESDSILDILLHLDRLRKKTEKTFPNARAFKRPGFDTISD